MGALQCSAASQSIELSQRLPVQHLAESFCAVALHDTLTASLVAEVKHVLRREKDDVMKELNELRT